MMHNLQAKLNPGLPRHMQNEKKNRSSFHQQIDLNLGKKVIERYAWLIALCGAESWTLWKVDEKYLKSFEMWCWKRLEDISWTDRVNNKYYEVSRRKEAS